MFFFFFNYFYLRQACGEMGIYFTCFGLLVEKLQATIIFNPLKTSASSGIMGNVGNRMS